MKAKSQASIFSICIIIIILALTVTGHAGKTDGVLRVGWSQEPRTLNPMRYDTIQGGMIMRSMLYDTLLGLNSKLEVSPMLAKSWKVSDDGTVWTFDLVTDAKWHDGQPLTSRDIAFTYNYIIDNKIPNFINYLKNLEKIETPGPKTLVLTYKQPIATTASDLSSVFIVAKHKWEKIPGVEAVKYENAKPLGSGPFVFKTWKKNDHMSFKRNDSYWRTSPHLKQVVFSFFSSPDPMIMSLKQGNIDVIGSELTPIAAKALSRAENVKVVKTPNLYYRHICINGSDFGKGHPALRDPKVRRALAMAVDKEKLVKIIHHGYARPGLSLVMDAIPFFFNNQISSYPFDLKKAASLLDEAGWKAGPDGLRQKDGRQLKLKLLVIARWPEEMRAAEFIRSWWKNIGVDLTLQSADGGTILAELFPDYKHDMYLWGFSGQPDPNFSISIYMSSQIQKWNGAGYKNPEYDMLFEQQARAVNPKNRQKLIYKMQEIHYKDSPSIVLYYMSAIGAYRSDYLEGFDEEMPGGIISFLNRDNFVDVKFK
jgi:peptide/nickel transport system substrate-binding protein